MLGLFWFVLFLFLIGASAFPLVLSLWGREIYKCYGGSRAVTCPENHQQVAVSFDALHAAVTGLRTAAPDLRLSSCTRWPNRADCGQECIPEARGAKPYTQGEVERPRTKKIYHLPVLIAASTAWVLGMLWHSEYAFRGRWAAALGISESQVREITGWWAPHLLSVAIPLLFAYGVGWLLACLSKKGVLPGVLTSTFLWTALTLASLAGANLAGISGKLLVLEAAYTFLASIAVGAIIGGLSGRLVEPMAEEKPEVGRFFS